MVDDDINRFLNGGHTEIKKELTEKMLEASEKLDFERAKEFVTRLPISILRWRSRK